MIYILIDVEFDEYCGHTVFVGPTMSEKKLMKLINEYTEEFDIIFEVINEHFKEKYQMEFEAEKELEYYEQRAQDYIDCEVHNILQQILDYDDEQHCFEGEYCKMYVDKKMHENHNFELEPDCTNIYGNLYDRY